MPLDKLKTNEICETNCANFTLNMYELFRATRTITMRLFL